MQTFVLLITACVLSFVHAQAQYGPNAAAARAVNPMQYSNRARRTDALSAVSSNRLVHSLPQSSLLTYQVELVSFGRCRSPQQPTDCTRMGTIPRASPPGALSLSQTQTHTHTHTRTHTGREIETERERERERERGTHTDKHGHTHTHTHTHTHAHTHTHTWTHIHDPD